jgi:hypothetical protein
MTARRRIGRPLLRHGAASAPEEDDDRGGLLGWTLGRLQLGFCLLHARQIEKRGEGLGLDSV